MFVSRPVIERGSILKRQLPGPTFGNRFVHFLNRYRLASPGHNPFEVHDRASLRLEDDFAFFILNEAHAIPRLDAKLYSHLNRDGDLSFGSDCCGGHGVPLNEDYSAIPYYRDRK